MATDSEIDNKVCHCLWRTHGTVQQEFAPSWFANTRQQLIGKITSLFFLQSHWNETSFLRMVGILTGCFLIVNLSMWKWAESGTLCPVPGDGGHSFKHWTHLLKYKPRGRQNEGWNCQRAPLKHEGFVLKPKLGALCLQAPLAFFSLYLPSLSFTCCLPPPLSVYMLLTPPRGREF